MDNELGPARGLCLGYAIGGIIWVVVFAGAAILISRWT